MAELEMDKPWPLSYLAWLYDPADRGQVQVLPYGRATTTPPLAASVGILADDPGVSWQYAPGVPIRALFGATLRELLAVFTPLLLLLMLIAAWQRRGRPQLQDGIRPPAQQDVADRYRGLRPARYY